MCYCSGEAGGGGGGGGRGGDPLQLHPLLPGAGGQARPHTLVQGHLQTSNIQVTCDQICCQSPLKSDI